jgi:hypothetical protein
VLPSALRTFAHTPRLSESHAPAILKEKLDRAEAHVRARFADLEALLADRGENARRLYQSLFPKGLRFTHVKVGRLAAWRIQGTAEPFSASIVTPPGIEPGIAP